MGLLDAFLLGVLEGLTEFLPVSSTGHLILLSEWLGHHGEAAKSFDIIIQLGAIIAVAVHFRTKLAESVQDVRRREGPGVRLFGALIMAFVPTAIVGLALHKIVKERLFGPMPVAYALVVGGVIMIAADIFFKNKPAKEGVECVTLRAAFIIGLCQCLSLWPGASRSMTTIVGGRICGLSTKTAAEFSFLLALPTLGAATVFELVKNGGAILDMPLGLSTLLVGLLVSFAVAWLVVALFLKYIGRIGLAPFGIYRIAIGLLVLRIADQAVSLASAQ